MRAGSSSTIVSVRVPCPRAQRYNRKLWIGGVKKATYPSVWTNTKYPGWQGRGKETPPMLKVLDNDRGDNETTADEDAAPTLDELARTGARKMLMTALAVEVAQYVDAHQEARDEQGRRLVVRNGRRARGRSRAALGRWRSRRRGCTTSGWTRQASPSGSRVGSCPRICAVRRRWRRCSRSSTCGACQRAISARPCRCCWETTRPASVRPTSRGSRRCGRRTTGGSASGTWPTATTCMSGSTASTSTSGSRTTGCVRW